MNENGENLFLKNSLFNNQEEAQFFNNFLNGFYNENHPFEHEFLTHEHHQYVNPFVSDGNTAVEPGSSTISDTAVGTASGTPVMTMTMSSYDMNNDNGRVCRGKENQQQTQSSIQHPSLLQKNSFLSSRSNNNQNQSVLNPPILSDPRLQEAQRNNYAALNMIGYQRHSPLSSSSNINLTHQLSINQNNHQSNPTNQHYIHSDLSHLYHPNSNFGSHQNQNATISTDSCAQGAASGIGTSAAHIATSSHTFNPSSTAATPSNSIISQDATSKSTCGVISARPEGKESTTDDTGSLSLASKKRGRNSKKVLTEKQTKVLKANNRPPPLAPILISNMSASLNQSASFPSANYSANSAHSSNNDTSLPSDTKPKKSSNRPTTTPRVDKELLTEEQKKTNHVLSEQRRRALIKEGFDLLERLTPSLAGGPVSAGPGNTGGGHSKSTVLFAAAKHIEELQSQVKHLEAALAQKQDHISTFYST